MNTALGAIKNVCDPDIHTQILFNDSEHENFFYNSLLKCRHQDVYHQAICYCLGISSDTRAQASSIYDFKSGYIQPDCLNEGWITSGSRRIVLLAFNLYTDGTPTVNEDDRADKQLGECRDYSVSDLFCCAMPNTFGKQFNYVIQNM